VLTLGGTAISYVFQSFGEERDARARQVAFERHNLIELHRNVNHLIANRVIAMVHIRARLAGGDYAGAWELRCSDHDQAVAAWNQNMGPLRRALKNSRLAGRQTRLSQRGVATRFPQPTPLAKPLFRRALLRLSIPHAASLLASGFRGCC
jgi:hypothetical protein